MSDSKTICDFLVIEGNIGAGKTTLCQSIAKQFNARLILEQFADNPFLPLFYQNPERHAFSVELFFMTERHRQLEEAFSKGDLFKLNTISDYIFLKTLLFAKKNLIEQENRLFQKLFNILNASFPKPDLLVYLHRPVEELLKNIAKRGRSYEQEIGPEYLLEIQAAYFDYFKVEKDIPILIIDATGIDFVEEPKEKEKIIELITQRYPKGITRVSL